MSLPLSLSVGMLVLWACFPVLGADPSSPKAPGLGDPGTLQAIVLDTGRSEDGNFTLAGRDASQQLLVTGKYSSGQVRDLTRGVQYAASPTGVVTVDATGHVQPVGEGKATISVQADGVADATLEVEVSHLVQDKPINFPNQLTPLFTKYGCNGGGCHGKSGGQNSFRLSLLGFEPRDDYEYLVKEGRLRRITPSAPDHSLLLLKATGRMPHSGGVRFEIDSPPYRLIKRWISQGMPYGSDGDAAMTRIEILPLESLLERGTSQQLAVTAHYSDGSTEDVTRMAQFDSNDNEMGHVTATGLVTMGKQTGSVAIMARYQGHVAVFRGIVPLGVKFEKPAPSKNYIDELVIKNLQALGVPPSAVCDDSTFLRRVSIDLAGRLPTLGETEAFLADQDPNKRAQTIDRLLDSTDYADYFTNKWNAVLRNKRVTDADKVSTFAFREWIRESLHHNKPYDQFVRELLTATGEPGKDAPAAWYREVKDQASQVEDTAQLFLGVRIQCARCHHHPLEKWSQQDYFGLAAFYAQVGRKRGDIQGAEQIFHRRGLASAKNPRTGKDVKPTGLGGEPLEISADQDPRDMLADWMAAKDNPFFARTLVNRYWKHFFGRGLVEPEDDMRVTNPATNAELIDALAKNFIEQKFDLKSLCRTICNSNTYQYSADPNAWNLEDKQSFSRYYGKRLNAEVLLDAIDQLTGTQTTFAAIPVGTRAVQLPDNGFTGYFLTVFGKPEASSACECERSSETNLAQSLHLLNSSELQDKLANPTGRAAALAADKERPHDARIRELYMLAFSRVPTTAEMGVAVGHIEKYAEDPKRAYEDILWALINSKDFLFNH